MQMTTSKRGRFEASVAERVPLCREHYRVTFSLPSFPPTFPGQFLQVLCRPIDAGPVEHEFDWSPGDRVDIEGVEFGGPMAFLRRPFSIAGRRDFSDRVELDLIGREVGPGTRFLSQLNTGDRVSLIGPLGNTFTLPEPGGIAILVGGGVGIPPMIYLAQAIASQNQNASDRHRLKAVAFCGATTRDLLALTIEWEIKKAEGESPKAEDGFAASNTHRPNDTSTQRDPADRRPQTADTPLFNIREFTTAGVPAVISTDDGSYGFKGFVTDALERYLDAWITDNADRNRAIVYTCGPEPMMKRVAAIASARNIRCQVAVERAMACGMGTCQSCCIRVKKSDPAKPPLPGKDWRYALACTDGPVFAGDELLW